ncbi:cobalamin B12-binding domain-containing protein [Desulfoluna butyratoxydans]|uniref:Cobalamin (Vitamin b12)-binding domain n=1 Tax=Desulfoluna butyratoxydans TaxID=231438 RepID=A0A4U8YIK8_9BACT|nr:cobalamin-dependent protein [Desulfoluna butyratoxydans]VFQ43200.1 cobalamin (vitamin b12)-binding domain [Desulfoluna butyratoxydans]
MADLKTITDTLIAGDDEALVNHVKAALDQGMEAGVILSDGLIAGMDVVGGRMETGEMFIPEVLMSAMAMGTAVEILKPLLSEDDNASVGKVVIGTVKGDLHDIGKNLVVMMMESAGFEVTDLGVDVEIDTFLNEIREKQPDIVGLSALLTTTMPMMKSTVEQITASGLRDGVKIMVGGAPVDQAFADEIGADAYAADAGSASKLAKAMLA